MTERDSTVENNFAVFSVHKLQHDGKRLMLTHDHGHVFVLLIGAVDPSKCSILEGGSLLEVQQGIYAPLTVEARDKFGNICPLPVQDVDSYGVEVTEVINLSANLILVQKGNMI